MSTRWVLHVDMDAFFAAVEVKEDPVLSGKPVVVGGTGPRGVVASASYEARGFGVHSAMPGREARRLCPHLVFLPARFELYHHYSELLHGVLQAFTPLVEGIGLDEAFLDVTGAASLFGTPAEMAAEVRQRVSAELGLKCSVGAGPNKLVAKLASKAAKPRASQRGPSPGPGAVVVTEDEVLNFIWPMPVEALWGVGPASRERLHKVGVTTVGQLAALPEAAVVGALGKSAGEMVHSLSWGRDARAVVADRELKSIGHEETFSQDLVDPLELERHVLRMAESVATMLRGSASAARTVTVKVKFRDLSLQTRSHTLERAITTGGALGQVASSLLSGIDPGEGIRLLGVSASGLVEGGGDQLSFDLGDDRDDGTQSATSRQQSWQDATAAIDAIRDKFGRSEVGSASMVTEEGVRVPARRDAPWGPSE